MNDDIEQMEAAPDEAHESVDRFARNAGAVLRGAIPSFGPDDVAGAARNARRTRALRAVAVAGVVLAVLLAAVLAVGSSRSTEPVEPPGEFASSERLAQDALMTPDDIGPGWSDGGVASPPFPFDRAAVTADNGACRFNTMTLRMFDAARTSSRVFTKGSAAIHEWIAAFDGRLPMSLVYTTRDGAPALGTSVDGLRVGSDDVVACLQRLRENGQADSMLVDAVAGHVVTATTYGWVAQVEGGWVSMAAIGRTIAIAIGRGGAPVVDVAPSVERAIAAMAAEDVTPAATLLSTIPTGFSADRAAVQFFDSTTVQIDRKFSDSMVVSLDGRRSAWAPGPQVVTDLDFGNGGVLDNGSRPFTALSHDFHTRARPSGAGIVLLDRSGNKIADLDVGPPGSQFTAMGFDADDRHLVLSGPAGWVLFDARTGRRTGRVDLEPVVGGISGTAQLTANGRYMMRDVQWQSNRAFQGEGNPLNPGFGVQLFDPLTGAVVMDIPGGQFWSGVTPTERGALVVVLDTSGVLVVWDVEHGRPLARLGDIGFRGGTEPHLVADETFTIEAVRAAISLDGLHAVSIGPDGVVSVWALP